MTTLLIFTLTFNSRVSSRTVYIRELFTNDNNSNNNHIPDNNDTNYSSSVCEETKVIGEVL